MTKNRRKLIEFMLSTLHVYDRRMDDKVRTALTQAVKELIGNSRVEILVNAGCTKMSVDKTGISLASVK